MVTKEEEFAMKHSLDTLRAWKGARHLAREEQSGKDVKRIYGHTTVEFILAEAADLERKLKEWEAANP